MDPNPTIAAQLTPFSIWAEMHDGTIRRLTIYGYGATYQERLQDAKTQAVNHHELKRAKTIIVR
jgi:hypothetical protein